MFLITLRSRLGLQSHLLSSFACAFIIVLNSTVGLIQDLLAPIYCPSLLLVQYSIQSIIANRIGKLCTRTLLLGVSMQISNTGTACFRVYNTLTLKCL
jgi:hypothetical protein